MTKRLQIGLGLMSWVRLHARPQGLDLDGSRCAPAKNFRFRANKLMETAIIERGQGFGRWLLLRRARRVGADYNPRSESRSI